MCNAVVVAALLNATLVLPRFLHSSVWKDKRLELLTEPCHKYVLLVVTLFFSPTLVVIDQIVELTEFLLFYQSVR